MTVSPPPHAPKSNPPSSAACVRNSSTRTPVSSLISTRFCLRRPSWMLSSCEFFFPFFFPPYIYILTEKKTRQMHPLLNLHNPPLLPTARRPPHPAPEARPRLSLRAPHHPDRPRRHPLRAVRRDAHGAGLDVPRGTAA